MLAQRRLPIISRLWGCFDEADLVAAGCVETVEGGKSVRGQGEGFVQQGEEEGDDRVRGSREGC